MFNGKIVRDICANHNRFGKLKRQVGKKGCGWTRPLQIRACEVEEDGDWGFCIGFGGKLGFVF